MFVKSKVPKLMPACVRRLSSVPTPAEKRKHLNQRKKLLARKLRK